MKPSVRHAFVPFTSPLEGVVPWMYLDELGLVTVAIGNLIDPIELALALPFVRQDGTPATREEIREAWAVVKAHQELAQQGHRVAARFTSIRLTDEGVAQVVGAKLEQNDASLRAHYPGFEEWPADAQLAAHSMAWACGAAFGYGGPRPFRKLDAALLDFDFVTAAAECTINPQRGTIVQRNAANRMMFMNAARVVMLRLDPEVLHWPDELHDVETDVETPRVVSAPIAIIHPKLQFDPRPVDVDGDEPPPDAA
jgi:hypothetical protein